MTDETEILLTALKRAAEAHHAYEQSLGKPDPDWPEWYAKHMVETLHAEGYHLHGAHPQRS